MKNSCISFISMWGGYSLLILSLFTLLTSNPMKAQDEGGCLTSSNFPDLLEGVPYYDSSTSNNNPPGTAQIPGSGGEMKYLRLYIHILRKSDGTGGRTIEDAINAVEIMKGDFEPHNISFVTECIEYMDDDLFHNGRKIKKVLDGQENYDINQNIDGIDIYIKHSTQPTNGGGKANGIPGDALLVGGNIAGIDVLMNGTLSHEMGHCLGLFHTHHGTCKDDVEGEENIPCPEDLFQPEYDDNNNCTDCNCRTCGDYVCQTKAAQKLDLQPYEDVDGDGFFTDDVDYFTIDCENPKLSDDVFDLCTPGIINYYPEQENLMSYAPLACTKHFVEEQGLRMQKCIEASVILQNCLISTGIPDITISGLPQSVLWDTPQTVEGTVTIDTHNELIISNTTITFANEHSAIIVKKGGKLIVNNAILQREFCSMPWRGIEVLGNPNYPQTELQHHGKVELDNVIIFNAKIGVRLGHTEELENGGINNIGGGLLEANNTTFQNCSVGIEFEHYLYDNESIIDGCTFLIDNEFLGSYQYPLNYIGIRGHWAYGIDVKNCTFKNISPGTFDNDRRGLGVFAITSNFNLRNNSFENLYKGVDAYAYNSIYSKMAILDNTFSQNIEAITLNANLFSEVKGNTFEGLSTDFAHAVYANDCDGILIKDNTFWAMDVPVVGMPIFALTISGSNGVDIINNDFKNFSYDAMVNQYFTSAVQLENNNTNVLIDCNRFSANSLHDLRIMPGLFSNRDGCPDVNLELTATRNTWHDATASGTSHITNLSDPFVFTYYDPDGDANTLSPYAPILLTGLTSDYCFIGDENCSDNPNGEGSGDPGPTSGDPPGNQGLKFYIDTGDFDSAKGYLSNQNTNWAKRVLATSYIYEKDYASATSVLNQMSLLTTEDSLFNNLFGEYIFEKTDTSHSTSMSISVNIDTSSGDKRIKTYAQSIRASEENIMFDRTPSNTTVNAKTKDNIFGEHKLNWENIRIYPNPAKDDINISIYPEHISENTWLNIYDYQGRLLKQIAVHNELTILNTADFNNGMYFCRLIVNDKTVTRQKFTIIK